uniref:TaqI-like C-terminal specificity domain-containing protein n=1 Tax=Lunatimonas salinarum TaxID=1774590 RepID=UPI002473F177
NEPPRYGYMDYDPAWEWLTRKYPAIARHLKPYEAAAKKRTDKGDFWWELRACDYYEEFEKEKIIIPAIVKGASYCYDTEEHYSNDKTTIIPSRDFFLLGILNSKVIDFYLKSIASTKQNGYFEYKPVYIAQLPIVIPNPETHDQISILVTEINETKKQDPTSDTSILEAKIDQLVYEMYGLSEEEIGIVEGGKT